ncbi:hypothetical protein G7Y79_00028g062770 [Physcia stellaris]|nr:hypothetical protein G7Y79_00028g062770 [Physcia stellaris]
MPQWKNTNPQVQTKCLKADLTSQEVCRELFTADIDLVYLLHGLMSGASEANLELGIKVNIDSMRQIFDILRDVNPGVKIVFPSSTAVYGPPDGPDEVVTERTAPLPGSSYGAQKHITETLLNDYSRRGLLDGRIIRLPTVLVRPGKPTGAASSFASGIFREPLNGEKSVLPVSRDLKLWICSPRTVVKNLIHARDIAVADFGTSRIVNLPGRTVTVEEMLEALERIGGRKALDLIEEKRDEATEKIVESWPTMLQTSIAEQLGFSEDVSLEQTLKDYLEDYGP